VRACEVDSIGHVNNAVYLDLATQAVLDAIEDAGWSLERMLAAGRVPVLARADLEYLEGARSGDQLAIAAWFAWAPVALDAGGRRAARGAGEHALALGRRGGRRGAGRAGRRARGPRAAARRLAEHGGSHGARGPRGRGHRGVVRHRPRGRERAGRRRRARRA